PRAREESLNEEAEAERVSELDPLPPEPPAVAPRPPFPPTATCTSSSAPLVAPATASRRVTLAPSPPFGGDAVEVPRVSPPAPPPAPSARRGRRPAPPPGGAPGPPPGRAAPPVPPWGDDPPPPPPVAVALAVTSELPIASTPACASAPGTPVLTSPELSLAP